jgi:MFS family permease
MAGLLYGHFDRQIRTTFRSLKYRNYRLFFCGQGLSLIGTWMQHAAQAWLVYRLSNSAMALGLTAFCGQIPGFILAPIGGVAADRYSKHRIILLTQILAMLQAVVLAALVLSGRVEVWHLILLSTVLGIINAFDIPTRQAFVIEMVEDNDYLSNAIALNSSMFNAARIIGPAAAGLLTYAAGEGLCFLINAVSFFAVILSLLLMKPRRVAAPSNLANPLTQLKNGFVYAWRFSPIKYVICFVGVTSLVGMPYIVLMPVFAREILGGGPQTYGLLLGSAGAGATMAALYMAARRTTLGLGKLLVLAGALFGTSLVFFSFSASMWFSMGLLLFCGFGMMVLVAGCNTLLQTMVDDDKRGIVMSIYLMAFVGTTPLGSLAAGFLAHRMGVNYTLLIGGILCLLASGLFAKKLPLLQKMIHPVYVQKGIIKEVAQGLQSAAGLTTPPED